MILAEFLSFKKFDIEEDIINNPTSFTVDSLTQSIIDSINLLRPIRSSSQRTAKVIKSIMENHMRKREIGGHYDENNNRVPDTWVHERTIESDILKLWIYRYSEQNLSYNNAYNALVPYLNTGNAFPVNLRQIEDIELIEFIKKDDEEEIKHEKYTRKKNNDRTKITIHTDGIKITGDAELDKSWNINKREADDENYRRKELAEKRESMLNELGNKIILATEETTLIQAKVELLNLERINIGWKYSNLDELVCTDDLGNEIWLRSGETKTFEEREKEINSLKELIENKLLLISKTNKTENSDLKPKAAISKGDTSIERQLAQEYAAITRPLSTSFPSFRTYAALKLKKQQGQLKKTLLDDFNEFNSMIELVPNNESERQNMIDQLESFSVQYPDWTFEVEESKKIVSALEDGRRDDIIFNTICKLKDLKDEHSYRNLISDLDNYIDILKGGNQTIKLNSKDQTQRKQTFSEITYPSTIQYITNTKNENIIKNKYLEEYLEEIQNLNDSIHTCWEDAWDETLNEINIENFKTNIRSYGDYYPLKPIIKKKEPKISIITKVPLNFLLFVGKLFGVEELKTEDGYDDRIKFALSEIRENLFGFNNVIDKKAYANIILRDINKIDFYNQANDFWEYSVDYDLLFLYLNDFDFFTDEKIKQIENEVFVFRYGNCLQVRFAKHLHFISELTQLLKCFQIDIMQLAEDANLKISLINTGETEIMNPSISDNNYISDDFEPPQEIERKVKFTIDANKYDPDKIFNQCISKKVFKCDKDIFDAWLVDGTGSLTGKIRWLFQGGNKAQLRAFMNKITGANVKPAQLNKIFDVIKVDSHDNPGILCTELEQILILSPIKKEK